MSDSRPVGILDSGLGGLSVCREITRLMPGERMVYLGDTAGAPLGNRSAEVIKDVARKTAVALLENNIKMMVIACDTIAAVAYETIESVVKDIPVIGGVMPCARAAALRTGNRKVGLIGTSATIRSGAFSNALQRIDESVQIHEQATPLFHALVEELILDHDITRLTAQFYLYEMIDLGVDCLILGSSCLSPLMEVIQGTVGTGMQLIDSALWTAKEAQDILTALDLRHESSAAGIDGSRFIVTQKPVDEARITGVYFGSQLPSLELRAQKQEAG
ncbi:MAG: glutamate racemase [Chitinispirillaceae bacterium]|nr:glutamate racemase [Chitinispirillaceae bacterium]